MHQSATLNWALGDYIMESVIRAGGRSTVYTARKRGASDLRALKVIAIGTDPNARAIVDAERRGAELQQEFARHHGLVPWVEEIGETRSCLYVAMELVPGEDLSDTLARGPIPAPRALDIAIELSTFLERTHRFEVPGRAPERIIHADLKPGNIRLRPDGQLSVLDFGIAKAMAERRIETTQKWGTRQYMSPEWLHTGTIDEQVDYWSLGVLLYEMLAGYRPFRRFERHDNQLEDAIRRRERPEALPPHIDLRVQQVVARLLAPDIRQRYGSATEIRTALSALRPEVPTLPALALARRPDVPTEPVKIGLSSTPAWSMAFVASATHGSFTAHAAPAHNGRAAAMAVSPVMPNGSTPPGVTPDAPSALDSPPTEPCPREARQDASGASSSASTAPDTPPTEPCPRDGRIDAVVASSPSVLVPPIPDTPRTERRPPDASTLDTFGAGLLRSHAPSFAVPQVLDVPTDRVMPSDAASAAAAARAPDVAVPAGSSRRARRNTGRKVLAAVLWMQFAAILATEGIGCIAAERLRSDAAVADEAGLDAALTRRAQLAGWTVFDAGLHFRADPVLRDRLVSLADVVLANYRQEQPTVGRVEWEQARGWLMHAVGLYPDDRRLLAKLRYTEGHLQRLIGQRRAEGGQVKAARESYYAAIQRFREAASLDRDSPDPYLGLTHTYVYGLGDVDNAVEALKAAEKRGHHLNRRERAQLGDAYRLRGERIWRSARDLEGDQQRDAYDRAKKDFKQCVESFTPIVEFANAADQLHRCEARLAEIEEHSTPWWKRLFESHPDLDVEIPKPPAPNDPR